MSSLKELFQIGQSPLENNSLHVDNKHLLLLCEVNTQNYEHEEGCIVEFSSVGELTP